jgi:hypothetical protein
MFPGHTLGALDNRCSDRHTSNGFLTTSNEAGPRRGRARFGCAEAEGHRAVVRGPGSEGQPGRRRQKWHSGYRSKREAEKGLTSLLSAQDSGTYVEPQRLTLGTYLADRWLPAIETTVRPTTFNGYERHVRVYINPNLGSYSLQAITPDLLSRLYREPRQGGGRRGGALAPATVRRVHATLHRALKDAVA